MASPPHPVLQRCCEPELMLDSQQARAYAEADFSAGDADVVDRLAAAWQPLPAARLLDLGCGPGNITFRLLHRWPQCHVVAVDGSEAMLAIAQERWQQRGGGHRLSLIQSLLPLTGVALQSLSPPFDALISNSLLHHLHDPSVLWNSIRRLGRPGTVVQVVDLRRPCDEEQLQELMLRHGSCLSALVRRDYEHSLRAAFTPEEVDLQLRHCGLSELTVRPVDDQLLEVFGYLGSDGASPAGMLAG